jgi:hypothetical protein
MLHDAALPKVGQFRRSFDRVPLELGRDDDVCHSRLCHLLTPVDG